MKELVREHTFRWEDPRAAWPVAAQLDGLGWLKALIEGRIPPPPIVQALGMQLEAAEHGTVRFSLATQEWMCNPAAVIHGGIAATLLDTVLTLAVVSKLPHGKRCTTVQLGVNYVRPILSGERIVAEGGAVHVGTTVGTAEGRLYNAHGKLAAHGTATLALLPDTQ